MSSRRLFLIIGSIVLVAIGIATYLRRAPASLASPALHRQSADCRACHAEIYRTWAESHHALAHRAPESARDEPMLGTAGEFTLDDVSYRFAWADGKPTLREQRRGGAAQDFAAEFILGHTPLRQLVVPVGGGRYQMTELARDPAKREWFNVFAGERRQPGEWGHWTGRGMNWNSMCAHCHLTDFRKNYDAATDTYASTWTEHGIGCVQCHESITAEHTRPGYRAPAGAARTPAARSRQQQTCAPCHARNELLTGEPRAGMNYDDHFRVALPVDAAAFYPDGQMRDEVFNWTSLLTSRMGAKAGVTCLDCHEPHSGKTRLPAVNNALCQQCHGHGSPTAKNAPVIDPVAHSRHQAETAGNQCVSCHMPTTTYMQRDARHDHGFLKPDPLLTKELGIPNACDRCHRERGIDWQIDAATKWFGPKLESRQRERARAIAAAQKGETGAGAKLAALSASEEVPAWKATLLLAARAWPEEPAVAQAARHALGDASPLVRSAAVQVLAGTAARDELKPALKDSTRLVRLDAAWALAAELAPGSPERAELEAYLRVTADQPVGQMKLGQLHAAHGRFAEAETAMRKANTWDPNSGALHEAFGLFLDGRGRSAEAAAELWRAAQLEPRNAQLALDTGLALAAAGKIAEAETALREAVRRDPALHRAWYNLGLLLAQSQRATDGIAALERAETLAPREAAYPYARATLLWNRGDRDAARAAARRVLEIDPRHTGAQALVGTPAR